jgi:di/tricarboxylate transporter
MTGEILFVFAVIGAAAVLMASNRVRFDIVALLVVLALMLSGVLSVGEALSGFGNSVVILVACLLVVGEMLDRTGVARALGDIILKKGGTKEGKLLIAIMAGAGLVGGVMSSTAVVAIFIPIALRIAAETNINASRLLLPMSYAALISGMLTLIATTPNLVVHEELRDAGFDGFGFFSFAPIGLGVLIAAIGYMLLLGRRLLSAPQEQPGAGRRGRSIDELWVDYCIGERIVIYQVQTGSGLAGQTIAESALHTTHGARVLGIKRRGRRSDDRIATPSPQTQLFGGDNLVMVGEPVRMEQMARDMGMTVVKESARDRQLWFWEMGSTVVLIHPESTLIGKTLRESEFRSNYSVHVVGVRRGGEPLQDFQNVRLQASDTLLVSGPWSRLQQLQSQTHDFVVLEMPREQTERVQAYRRMPVALTILAGMVLLTLFDVVPLTAAVIMAAMAAVFTRCLTMNDSYRAIHWSSLVLIAGMLPLADALNATGGTQWIVDQLLNAVGSSGPQVMLTVLFFLTAALGLVLSNTASAVLVAPIAITAAEVLEVSPYPFAVAVLIAASAAFVTPVSTPVVTLVVEPGRYKFTDFIKVGIPLLLITYLVTLVLAPLVFPYDKGM